MKMSDKLRLAQEQIERQAETIRVQKAQLRSIRGKLTKITHQMEMMQFNVNDLIKVTQ